MDGGQSVAWQRWTAGEPMSKQLAARWRHPTVDRHVLTAVYHRPAGGGSLAIGWRSVGGLPVVACQRWDSGALSACQRWSTSYWMAVSRWLAIGGPPMNRRAKRWWPASGIRRWTAECADSGPPKDLGWLANWVPMSSGFPVGLPYGVHFWDLPLYQLLYPLCRATTQGRLIRPFQDRDSTR